VAKAIADTGPIPHLAEIAQLPALNIFEEQKRSENSITSA